MLWLHMRSWWGFSDLWVGGGASPSSAHLWAEASVARLVHGTLEGSDSLLWSQW